MKRAHKFNAKRTNGYASALEARHAARLKLLMKAKDPKERVITVLEQDKIPLHAHRDTGAMVLVGYYVCDFSVLFADERVEYHECKGHPTELWKWKKRHFEAEYPDRKLVIITK